MPNKNRTDPTLFNLAGYALKKPIFVQLYPDT